MKKIDLQLELDLLLADRLISGFLDGQKYINWAISLMQRNYESENLDIIVGLDSNDGDSIKYYSGRLIEDLGLTLDRDTSKILEQYTTYIAQQVVNGEIEPLKGLNVMNIIIESDELDLSQHILNQFLCLIEDISLLGEYQLFYIGLTKENVDEVIIDEMRMLLIAQSKYLKDIINLIYCRRCESIRHSKYKKRGWFIKTGKCCCEKCDSNQYLAWNRVEDRKQILHTLENYDKAI